MDEFAGFMAIMLVALAVAGVGYIAGRERAYTEYACEIAWTAAHTEADSLRTQMAGC